MFDKMATGGYFLDMEISAKDAKNRLSELLDRAEAGETVVVTRHGKPVADVVPHVKKKKGINWEALEAYKKAHGIERIVTYIAPDFDDPLPEDFLITPTTDKT
jgi:prevent-host-death family protein